MKTTRLLKIVIASTLSIFTFIATSSVALADYLASAGGGGDYNYELWSSDNGSYYYLKIWRRGADPSSYFRSGTFSSSAEALEYFDCNYAGQSLPSCPKQ
jgi:hypothetical protein